jgi:FkbM family methyltransferase
MEGMSGHDYWDEPSVGEVFTVSRGGFVWKMHDSGRRGRIMDTLRGGNPVEPAVLDDMRELGLSGRAIDVGGGVGNHALWLAIACGLQVETFEPRLHEVIAANIATNGLDGLVTLYPVALGESAGLAHWSDQQRGHLEAGGGEVPVRTLDSYAFDDVALIKIDVEGMEVAVLAGALKTIKRDRPVIYAEANTEQHLEQHRAFLEPLGYKYGRRFKWHQHRWMP